MSLIGGKGAGNHTATKLSYNMAQTGVKLTLVRLQQKESPHRVEDMFSKLQVFGLSHNSKPPIL